MRFTSLFALVFSFIAFVLGLLTLFAGMPMSNSKAGLMTYAYINRVSSFLYVQSKITNKFTSGITPLSLTRGLLPAHRIGTLYTSLAFAAALVTLDLKT